MKPVNSSFNLNNNMNIETWKRADQNNYALIEGEDDWWSVTLSNDPTGKNLILIWCEVDPDEIADGRFMVFQETSVYTIYKATNTTDPTYTLQFKNATFVLSSFLNMACNLWAAEYPEKI